LQINAAGCIFFRAMKGSRERENPFS